MKVFGIMLILDVIDVDDLKLFVVVDVNLFLCIVFVLMMVNCINVLLEKYYLLVLFDWWRELYWFVCEIVEYFYVL